MRRRPVPHELAFPALLLLAACASGPTTGPDAAAASAPIARPGLGVVAPRVLWRFPEPVAHGSPVLDGGDVWVGGRSLVRLDAASGAERARLELDDEGFWHHPVPLADGVLAVQGGGSVQRLPRALDSVTWSSDCGASGNGVLVERAGEPDLFVVPCGAAVAALNVESGEAAWRTSLDGRVQMTPATDGERVFVGTEVGTFLALDAAGGAPLWERPGGATYGWTDPVVADGVVYVGDRGVGNSARREDRGRSVTEVTGNRAGALNAFDAATGELLWGTIFGATGLSRPFVSADRVWVGFGRSVVPFRRDTGEALWSEAIPTGTNPFGSPRVVGTDVVFGNLDGHLYVHDRATKELRWAFALEGREQVGDWVQDGGRLFVRTTKGLFALGDEPGAEPCPPETVLAWSEPETRAPAPPDDELLAALPAGSDELEPGALAEAALEEMHRALARLIEVERRADEAGEPLDAGLAKRIHAIGASLEARASRLEAAAGTREASAARSAPSPSERTRVNELAEAWTEVMFSAGEGSAEDREELLARMRAALAGEDAVERQAALWTLARSGEVDYDKASFRELLLPLARKAAGDERIRALYALYNTRSEEGDLALVHAAYDELSAAERGSIPHLLFLFGGGAIEGRSEEIVLELLAGVDGRTFRRGGFNGIWGARVTDRLAGRLVDLATGDDPNLRHDAIYYCLSTFADKNEAVVDVLIDALTDPDPNVHQRALWGLGQGVPAELQPKVVRALTELRDARSSPELRRDCDRLIERYGG